MNPKDKIGKTKVPLSYLSGPSLVHEALAMKNGADKYGRGNWRDDPVCATIYIDAALRHIFSWLDGVEYAEDSGIHHLGHAKATLAIILDAMEQGTLIDDRPAMGTMAGVLERLRILDENTQYKMSTLEESVGNLGLCGNPEHKRAWIDPTEDAPLGCSLCE